MLLYLLVSMCSLLIYRYTIDFCMLILYLVIRMNSVISSGRFFVVFFNFLHKHSYLQIRHFNFISDLHAFNFLFLPYCFG